MAERIVIDTGPLVAFSRAELLDVVGTLPFDFVCPEEVRQELAAGETAGYPRVEPKWLTHLSLSSPIDYVAKPALDAGETAVIPSIHVGGTRYLGSALNAANSKQGIDDVFVSVFLFAFDEGFNAAIYGVPAGERDQCNANGYPTVVAIQPD